MAGVFERTGELSWAEKAFALWLEAQQFAPAETLAQRILTNDSATVSTYMSLGTAYCRAGRLPRAEEVLDSGHPPIWQSLCGNHAGPRRTLPVPASIR